MMYFIFGILIVCGIVYFVFSSKKRKSENDVDASYECNICDDNNCYCEKKDEDD
ncbi:MAG: hypothetical protein AB7E04_00390 [Desulfobacteraceae bacterium]|jgi:Na+/H+ antiporter NhaC